MKITRKVPTVGTRRTRRVFAFLPKYFAHGTSDNPLITMVWLDYYNVYENYGYGKWVQYSTGLEEVIE